MHDDRSVHIMKRLSRWISGLSSAAALMVVALFATSATAHAAPPSMAPAKITYICQGWPVPTGYVITGSNGFTAACNGAAEYAVTLPVAGMAVCSISPIPNEFVVSSEFFDTTMCGIKELPQTLKGYRLSATAPGVELCSGTSRPTGYVTDRVVPTSQCLGDNAHVLKPLTEGVAACSMSRAPNGYVVTAGTPTANCKDGSITGDYWTFNQVYDGIQVCPFSPIPPGYYVASAVRKTNCYGASFGYVIKKG